MWIDYTRPIESLLIRLVFGQLSLKMPDSHSMKIALFHLGFYYSGGGEKLVLEEMRGLRALGHTVHVFAPYVDREGCFPDAPEIAQVRTLLPHPPRWLPLKDPLWLTISCLLIPLMAWRFRNYDVFLGANQPGAWFAYVLSRILGKQYIVYLAQALRLLHPRKIDLENGIRIRENDHRYLMALKRTSGRVIDLADRLSVRGAHEVLTNGTHVATWIREVYGIQSRVCPAGCHPIASADLEYATRWTGETSVSSVRIPRPFILLTNRHSPMKRFEYALWALKAIRRQTSRIALVITGQETEYTDLLRYLVGGLGLEDSVHFVGLVNETDLLNLYSTAAVYVYPSPEEDFGMGIVEAMAAGTPVVAWSNGGPTVTVRHGQTGFLVEPYDTDNFAESLHMLISNPDLAEQMGRAGHLRAAESFSYDTHCRMLEQALASAARIQSLAQTADSVKTVEPTLVEE